MSSQIYITYSSAKESKIVELTCSTDISVSNQNDVTQNPVESGSNIVDHVRNNPTKISIRGRITDIVNYSLDYFLPPSTIIKEMEKLWRARIPFTVNLDDSLDVYNNCVFSNYSVSQSSGMGTSWDVSIDIQQIRVTESATLSEFPEQSENTENQHAAKSQQSDSSTEESERNASNVAKVAKLVSVGIGEALNVLETSEEGE